MAAVAPLRDLSEVLRDGMSLQRELLASLAEGPKTIPEIAEVLHAPTREVTLWVMMLRRYGKVADLPKGAEEEYTRYRRVEGA
ncbi:MAG: MarR family transcriptional regulator [Euryarchaeota archaeon]|nr:MarR family transcriptional regulator [Euryarchaeota archaeon]MDE1880026.1 MarR family transcriptional regulator [Euryarchaeota archaeon]